jgi:hypothetical protein
LLNIRKNTSSSAFTEKRRKKNKFPFAKKKMEWWDAPVA